MSVVLCAFDLFDVAVSAPWRLSNQIQKSGQPMATVGGKLFALGFADGVSVGLPSKLFALGFALGFADGVSVGLPYSSRFESSGGRWRRVS